MILLCFLLFTLVIFIPVLLGLWKRASIQRETYNEAEEFYHAQLYSLKRDYEAKLIDAVHYQNARIEVQRRLIHHHVEAPSIGDMHSKSHPLILLSIIALIPLFASLLYGINGVPFFTAQSASKATNAQTQAPLLILKKLEEEVAQLNPTDSDYLSKNLLLGQLEEQMGMEDQAILHLTQALNSHFTPELAFHIADAKMQKDGHISAKTLQLYHKALDASPPQAAWRMALEERIAAGEHEQDQLQQSSTTIQEKE